ncbi:MAG: amino acid permease [Candidatus Aenigmarchaeota archaeon]|nr:amino acid permease [Candidatus Aenigmarchaeota archaeon]
MKKRKLVLKKELSLFQATLYGAGIILGAGIYVLIGVAAGIAGNALWLAFGVAALLAFFTGFSYAELSSMYPKDAAEYVYTEHAFKKRWFAFTVQWVMIAAGVISAATVALGFANYWTHLFGGSLIFVAAMLITILSVINYIGIKESVQFNVVSTVIEASGLLLVIFVASLFVSGGNAQPVDFFYAPLGLTSILSASALIFFAYIGFEEMVNVAEETKNPRKTMPKAVVLSLVISTVLYILVALSAVAVLGYEALSESKAPLTSVIERVFPNAGIVMSFIALFATSNTVLAILVVVSRMFYGLACNHSFPKICSAIGGRNTPYVSIVLVGSAAILTLFFAGIKTIASLTDIGVFTVYIVVNAALIWLRFKKPKARRAFKSPVNVGKFPVLAFLGLVASALMITYLDPTLILVEIVLIVLGLAVYRIFNK